ncbi:MetQ/NlpA family ABC transporter substrate-binding protein [Ammoniphilus sp. CFH 90114]|uniref:MetQ/NlpA family ABC transporter substrate-binding protein n=1 Tax=Ammoniphilus sp. CFH 90114 TaxID=2493665 RepID=UPI00100E2F2C|nr:MetQ/NlpA family ABC transporter substrate-binding protein [Ammoniphilus sp. CFH 90114]RXT15207.1 MetQ/NlpA family ABC transporter substrate-binding protein [Ammoniphilus sp. CFH 90114]
MKKWTKVLTTSILAVSLLAGCGSSSDQPSQASGGGDQVTKIKVGVTAGPHEEVMEKVKEVAAKDGLEIEIVAFNDYVQPNKVLAEGELDANSFQHEPYLERFKADHNLDLVKLANNINFPMGLYSTKIKDVSELEDGAQVGLPNDPTNGARALQLFEEAGLIKLKEGVGVKATIHDIAENPKNLKFKELEAAFIPKALDDLAVAAINTNFAMEHGYVPTKDSIFIEPSDSPWVNLIAVRTADKDRPEFQKLVKAYHSDEVKKFIEEHFQGSVVPSW